jgi:outer membrane protein TolC
MKQTIRTYADLNYFIVQVRRCLLCLYKNIKGVLIALFILVSASQSINAQATLTLENCIRIAQKESAEAKHAKNNYLAVWYQYKLYKKSYLPSISLSGTLPAFNRSISKITMPDGTEKFVSQSAGNYSGTISITQPIPFIGGQFFISSGLQRLDIYQDSTTTSYLANIINIGIRQPFSLFNPYKWQRKIEPLYLKEAKQVYNEALENAALQTIELYFSILGTQINLELTLQNKANTDTLLQIAKERYAVGKITEDEVLQIEVNILNLTFQIEELQITLHDKQTTLCYLLNLPTNIFKLEIPVSLSVSAINTESAYEQAVANSSIELSHKLRLLEAQREIARTKSENGFSVNLYASFGLSQSTPQLKQAYKAPLDQEQITLNFNIPILNWGAVKIKLKKAELHLTDVSLSVEQEKLSFKQQVNNTVNLFNIQSIQLQIVKKTIELSQKRYVMSKERYLGGKIGFLEYSVAQNEKDHSKIEYISILKKIWTKYYEIRKLTLFDFVENKQIESEILQY